MKDPIYCPYCQVKAVWVPDSRVYARSYGGYVYACFKCDAFIGCHKQGDNKDSKGSLANPELRRLRVEAHSLFDPLWLYVKENRGWRTKRARMAAYLWLAKEMGVPLQDCHIGMFRDDDVRRVIEICRAVYDRAKSKQAA